MGGNVLDVKGLTTRLARFSLRAFLDTGCALDCSPRGAPRVSVLLLLCNRAELSLACIQTLLTHVNDVAFELVLVDNGSRDETPELLGRLRGAKVIRNAVNVGYPKAVNQAARAASAEYLLLLNNDTQVLGKSLDTAVAYLDAHADVGVVGARVILLDGSLQEAGCSLLSDGWTRQLGRGQQPDQPAYNFCRDVDYCSGAFLMTRRRLFLEMGGLDEVFSPGYFEDPDYCVRLWQSGWRVVYHPDLAILHHENATSGAILDPNEQCRRNHKIFAARHANWLRHQGPPTWGSLNEGRISHDVFFKVLVVADAFPETVLPRLLARLQSLDAFVTLCHAADRPPANLVHAGLEKTIEVLPLNALEDLAPFLDARPADFDLILLAEAPPAFLRRPGLTRPACAVWRDGHFALVDLEWGNEAPTGSALPSTAAA